MKAVHTDQVTGKKAEINLKRDFWRILDHVKVVQIDIKMIRFFASHLETLRLGLGG